jgi:hypothetical protein
LATGNGLSEDQAEAKKAKAQTILADDVAPGRVIRPVHPSPYSFDPSPDDSIETSLTLPVRKTILQSQAERRLQAALRSLAAVNLDDSRNLR